MSEWEWQKFLLCALDNKNKLSLSQNVNKNDDDDEDDEKNLMSSL